MERGQRREEVAARFEVSVPTIEWWIRLKREAGGLARRPVPGPAAVKTEALLAALPQRLVAHADATLADQCSLVARCLGGRGEHGDDESGAHPAGLDAQERR